MCPLLHVGRLPTAVMQRLDSSYVTRYSQFAKNTDPVPKTLAHGDQFEIQPFTIINK